MAPPKQSQQVIDDFWKANITPITTPTKASAVLPRNIYAQMVERQVPRGATVAESIDVSYIEARKHCEAKVMQIIKECLQVNQKYCDPFFNLDRKSDCITPLSASGTPHYHELDKAIAKRRHVGLAPGEVPKSIKRVPDIFDNPQFFVEGASANDIRQGLEGDCWFLSALETICSLEPARHLVDRICVKYDQDVGVYGFLLYRDGEWNSVIIDDKLYLRAADYEDTDEQTRAIWENNRIRVNSQEEYRKEFQTNSRALLFAQSTDPNETWVPLLEKAFAKAHGDYGAIEGGSVGEGVEDLTGGISTTLLPSNILSKDRLWAELLRVNQDFLFGCGTPNWDDPLLAGRDGIQGGHAYSILRAVEYADERLLMVRNPWGKSEWNGPWSDGSAQWNAQSIQELGHTFGDDGVFWIPYLDLLKKYSVIWRTRLFSSEWKVTQQWTSLAIPWAGDYQDAKFEITLTNATRTVIVLSQLDDRYFKGLEGQYSFELSFRVHKAGAEDYIIRTMGELVDPRSVSVELDLESGRYEIHLKVTGTRNDRADKVEDVIKLNWLDRRDKLLQIGLAYDLAHAKAQVNYAKLQETGHSKEPAPSIVKPGAAKKVDMAIDITTEGNEDRKSNTLLGDITHPDAPEPEEGEKKTHNVDDDKDSKDDDDDDDDEAWGAVCVVGLRVFCKDADATIQIVRPKKEQLGIPVQKLDVDDPARDAADAAIRTEDSDEARHTEPHTEPHTDEEPNSEAMTEQPQEEGELDSKAKREQPPVEKMMELNS